MANSIGWVISDQSGMLLITGSTGFIGRAVLQELSEAGYPIRILLRPSRLSPNLPHGIPVEVALSSLTDKRGIRAAMVAVDMVIHLASGENSGARGYHPEMEILGARYLAEAASEAEVKRILFVSHLGANPTSAYTVLRVKAMIEDHVRECGVPYTILRSGIVYGPGDHFTTSLAKMLSFSPIIFPIPGDGEILLQPLFVKDLAKAIVWSLDETHTIGQTFDVGGPEFLSLRQVTGLILQAMHKRRILVSIRPPYLRAGAWLMERFFRHPLVTTFWLDYLAVDRIADLQTLPREFSLQPARMENHLWYLQARSWGAFRKR